VHDIADLEGRGVPGVFVASSEFVDAADAQARALGFPAARVFVAHPIQDRTDREMVRLAESALDEIIQWIVNPAGPHERADAP
jgi:hypothetical protein